MKRISASIIITILVFAFNTAYVQAQISKFGVSREKPAATDSSKPDIGQKKEELMNTKIENFKDRAIKEIERRIDSLTNAIDRISEAKRLTDAQKSLLASDIQSEVSSLTELSKKIETETNIEILRQDVKSIVTSYRIYLLYLPQIRIIVAANGILNAADKMSELATKLESRIKENQGKDVVTGGVDSLESILADMRAKIEDAKTQANNAINIVSQLKPTEYPGNKTELQKAKEMLRLAHKDLKEARQDAQKIIVELKKVNKDIKGNPFVTTPVIMTPEIVISPTTAQGSIPNTQVTE